MFRLAFALLAFTSLSAAAQNTFYYKSMTGDAIGGGAEATVQPQNVQVTPMQYGTGVSFSDSNNQTWSLRFTAAPFFSGGKGLAVRSYDNAEIYPFNNPKKPGMDVSAGSRDCNDVSGAFNVLELTVNSVAIDFVQSCDGGPLLYGAVRINSSIPVSKPIVIPPQPPNPHDPTPNSVLMISPYGDWIGAGQTISLNSDDGIYTATFHKDKCDNNELNSCVHIHFEGDTWWDFTFSGPKGLAVGHYNGAVRFPFNQSSPGLDVSGDGRGCNDLVGSFDIRDIKLKGNTLTSFAADFVQSCDGGPNLAGSIRFNSTIPPIKGGASTKLP